jgi:hypothetical protein
VRRLLKRTRIGVQQVLDEVRVGGDRIIESRARTGRAAFSPELPNHTRIRPQGLNIVVVLVEQLAGILISTELQ